MNMIDPGMNVLATCETLSALDVFTGDAHEKLVMRLEEYVRAQPMDMETAKGRDVIRSLAAKISRTKTGLDNLGKDHVAALKKQTGAVDAQRKLIRDRLDALRDEVRDPLTKFEEAEANRIDGHERALVWLAECDRFATAPTSAMVRAQACDVSDLSNRDWREFKERGDIAVIEAHARLSTLLLATEQAERDAAELIALRKLAAENDAREVAAKMEAEKAENARIAAEQEAARAAEAAERDRVRAEQQAARDAELAAQAVRNAEAAAARAVEDERLRVAKVNADADAAAAKLERNKKHRAKIHNEIAGFLMGDCGMSEAGAKAVVTAVAAGKIPHISIIY